MSLLRDGSDEETRKEVALKRDIKACNLSPLWEIAEGIFSEQPAPKARPFLWKGGEIISLLNRAAEMKVAGNFARRALTLIHPDIVEYGGANWNTQIGFQLVKPGELSPPHRHSAQAARFMTYYDPAQGGPLTPTFSADMTRLEAGFETRVHRHTSSSIYYVVDGQGWTIIEGQRFDWEKHDVLSIPAWAWHQHGCGTGAPATMFSINDEPMLRALNLYIEEPMANSDQAAGSDE